MDKNQIEAPFTPEQVKHLNEYQVSGAMHEFTCPAPNHPKRGRRYRLRMLVAAPAGWFCPGCGTFVQYWAWKFMADGELVKNHESVKKQLQERIQKAKGKPLLSFADFVKNKEKHEALS